MNLYSLINVEEGKNTLIRADHSKVGGDCKRECSADAAVPYLPASVREFGALDLAADDLQHPERADEYGHSVRAADAVDHAGHYGHIGRGETRLLAAGGAGLGGVSGSREPEGGADFFSRRGDAGPSEAAEGGRGV